MDIVKMVQNGQTPPNVRTDINDKPEDPEKPFDVQGELGKKPKVRSAYLDLTFCFGRKLTSADSLGSENKPLVVPKRTSLSPNKNTSCTWTFL